MKLIISIRAKQRQITRIETGFRMGSENFKNNKEVRKPKKLGSPVELGFRDPKYSTKMKQRRVLAPSDTRLHRRPPTSKFYRSGLRGSGFGSGGGKNRGLGPGLAGYLT